jgi:hypothetical protein
MIDAFRNVSLQSYFLGIFSAIPIVRIGSK